MRTSSGGSFSKKYQPFIEFVDDKRCPGFTKIRKLGTSLAAFSELFSCDSSTLSRTCST